MNNMSYLTHKSVFIRLLRSFLINELFKPLFGSPYFESPKLTFSSDRTSFVSLL